MAEWSDTPVSYLLTTTVFGTVHHNAAQGAMSAVYN